MTFILLIMVVVFIAMGLRPRFGQCAAIAFRTRARPSAAPVMFRAMTLASADATAIISLPPTHAASCAGVMAGSSNGSTAARSSARVHGHLHVGYSSR